MEFKFQVFVKSRYFQWAYRPRGKSSFCSYEKGAWNVPPPDSWSDTWKALEKHVFSNLSGEDEEIEISKSKIWRKYLCFFARSDRDRLHKNTDQWLFTEISTFFHFPWILFHPSNSDYDVRNQGRLDTEFFNEEKFDFSDFFPVLCQPLLSFWRCESVFHEMMMS